ncbi:MULTISPECIES: M23 family metallopeptidase [unclassified Treponema]|uniref:M23 family metallopeptidase n=1 Tax=unclassified Treponema TaxID=2638727 RepID=UPI0020A40FA5|nr:MULTISPECIES: M23 family metallopeptidase [unclassified Treponema]UTC67933.1 M23 family metallopeptidase [Treponema sp. OMZ 789]UTC70654.1 M23 family metallopeptidase [Treponema sp. OMZ 790]UTC73378.1 M23 family metallopeptidase [Treponema sp. OMZ 791]
MKVFKFLVFSFFLSASFMYAQIPYPHIEKLNIDDHIFVQYSDDVADARKALAAAKTGNELPLRFYTYKATGEDTIIKIAARCSIPYDAIVTLNRIESVQTDISGQNLILPTMPAVYLPGKSISSIEKLTEAFFKKSKLEPVKIKIYGMEGKRDIFCFPGEIFDGTIRAFFFMPFYRFPLKEAVLTSGFGKRQDPFTGKTGYHPGIDLAAPTGSPVMACAAGRIKEISYSNVYGNYIILAHTDGRISLYGHLSKVYVTLNETVKSGKIIGAVGSTGMSTGPHLHFEIHEQGIPKNPANFVNKNK